MTGRVHVSRLFGREHRLTLLILWVLIGLGVTLRVLLLVAWRPGFLGAPDSTRYLEAANGKLGNPAVPGTVFADTLRPAGYPIFLRLLHLITPHLTFAIAVQHVLGIATAVLLYLAVRRVGGPAWLGLVPAAIVLLGGTGIFLEHAALSEPLFEFLLALGLWAALCSIGSVDIGWALLAGLALGAAACVRLIGFVVVLTVAVWLLATRRDALRRTVLHVATLLGAGVLVVGAYVIAQQNSTGYTGIVSAAPWFGYARVAPFAECGKFTPPAGTRPVCESTQLSRRPGSPAYLDGPSPASRAFGYPDHGRGPVSSSEDNRKLGRFAATAAFNQPLDYLGRVARDAVRYPFPGAFRSEGDGPTSGELAAELQDQSASLAVAGDVVGGYYHDAQASVRSGLMGTLSSYERHTRIEGVVLIVLVLLAALAPVVAPARQRAGATLLAVVSLELLLVPVLAISYDARFAIPALGILGAGAALGGWSVWDLVQEHRSYKRTRRIVPGWLRG